MIMVEGFGVLAPLLVLLVRSVISTIKNFYQVIREG
jgi:hypothetical protein